MCFSKLHKTLLAHQVCIYEVMIAQREYHFLSCIKVTLYFETLPLPNLVSSNYSVHGQQINFFFNSRKLFFLDIEVTIKGTTSITYIRYCCQRAKDRLNLGMQ